MDSKKCCSVAKCELDCGIHGNHGGSYSRGIRTRLNCKLIKDDALQHKESVKVSPTHHIHFGPSIRARIVLFLLSPNQPKPSKRLSQWKREVSPFYVWTTFTHFFNVDFYVQHSHGLVSSNLMRAHKWTCLWALPIESLPHGICPSRRRMSVTQHC